MLRSFSGALGCLLCLVIARVHAEEILNIGDAAPALKLGDWVKGDKVEGFEPGKTYVVEFWATWCGPCRASIPHLTEMAKQYKDKDVKFIGVDVWENDPEAVRKFVEEMAEKMDYNVVLDSAGEGEREGAMAKNWMVAAEEHGIPTAFIIRDKKIAWIGHPMELEKPLEKITGGDWDLADAAKTRIAAKTKEHKLRLAREKILALYRAKDYKGTSDAIDELVKSEPELASDFDGLKFVALCKANEIDRALEAGAAFLKSNHDSPGALNNYAWEVIDPGQVTEIDPRLAKLALEMARRAVELAKEENASYLDTLAEALYRTGDAKQAVANEEKAIKIWTAAVKDDSNPELKEFNQHLERYRQAADKQEPSA
jgi:thiol-disulfide isomerase/thioredoxin/uncharacterized small protein (DUF1192 family)